MPVLLIQQRICVLGKHWFGSVDLTSISVRLLRFQLFSAENKMNSWSDSTGDTPHKTEQFNMHSSETSPNFPPRPRLKGLPIGSVSPQFSLSAIFSYYPLISTPLLTDL